MESASAIDGAIQRKCVGKESYKHKSNHFGLFELSYGLISELKNH